MARIKTYEFFRGKLKRWKGVCWLRHLRCCVSQTNLTIELHHTQRAGAVIGWLTGNQTELNVFLAPQISVLLEKTEHLYLCMWKECFNFSSSSPSTEGTPLTIRNLQTVPLLKTPKTTFHSPPWPLLYSSLISHWCSFSWTFWSRAVTWFACTACSLYFFLSWANKFTTAIAAHKPRLNKFWPEISWDGGLV